MQSAQSIMQMFMKKYTYHMLYFSHIKDSRTKKGQKEKTTYKGGNVMKVIAVSHGSYSKGLVDSVQMLVGEQENLVAYGLFPEQTVATLTEQLEREVNDTPEGEEILFLTDLFHGSPFNAVVSLMRDHEFHHITGINIPLAVEVMMGRYADKSAEEICRGIMEAAPDTVKYVNDLFDDEEEEE